MSRDGATRHVSRVRGSRSGVPGRGQQVSDVVACQGLGRAGVNPRATQPISGQHPPGLSNVLVRILPGGQILLCYYGNPIPRDFADAIRLPRDGHGSGGAWRGDCGRIATVERRLKRPVNVSAPFLASRDRRRHRSRGSRNGARSAPPHATVVDTALAAVAMARARPSSSTPATFCSTTTATSNAEHRHGVRATTARRR